VATVIVGTDIGRTGVLLDSGDLDRLGAAGRPTDVLLTAPGSLGQTAVQQVVGDRAQVTVIADERESGNDFVRLLELIALAILGLTVLIAVVGVGTTVALSVVERRVESGMLRAIGLTRGQLARVTLCEAALYGILGGACGLVIGLPHAWLSVRALGLAAPLSVPVTGLLAAALGLVTLTMAVGLLPALRAARTSPVEAMRAE
jgi:putative ABC transport system permease protein